VSALVVRVDGIPETVRALDALGAQIANPVDALDQVADGAAAVAARNTPSRTGRLRDTIATPQAAGLAVFAIGGPTTPYDRPVLYGWKHARPAPTLDAVTRYLEDQAAPTVDQGLDRLIGKSGF
jgi:hypothetical protein